ncbi:hypothetical protein HKX48_009049 [Thoreauomyces humboldtii]|nr:hypothetical protein HKX48_009049 [Thoreauomyces humboldtii]
MTRDIKHVTYAEEKTELTDPPAHVVVRILPDSESDGECTGDEIIGDEESGLALHGLQHRRPSGTAVLESTETLVSGLNLSTSSLAKPAVTPLPKKQMAVVCMVTFIEPLQFGVLFPFVYFLVSGFFPSADSHSVGAYVGLITSSFCVAQLITALPWGYMSDRIGRKPVLLIGLCGNALFMSLFGVSGAFWQAIVFRTACGVLNGNVGVAKSIIGEITDDSNRSLAFSLWETSFGMGAIVGPVIGGILATPTENLAFIFAGNTFLARYPYFLPCIACSAFSVAGILLTTFGYEETLGRTAPTASPERKSQKTLAPKGMDEGSDDKPPSHPALIHRGSTISLDEIPHSVPRHSLRSLMTVRILLPSTAYGLWALVQVVFDETLSIYAVADPSAHGLGLSSRTLGTVLASAGVMQVFAQAVLYPFCERRVGFVGCFKAACVGMTVFVVAAGLVPNVIGNPAAEGQVPVALVLGVVLFGRTVAIVFGYISIMIMINNSAPAPSTLGAVHGIGQMTSSAAR